MSCEWSSLVWRQEGEAVVGDGAASSLNKGTPPTDALVPVALHREVKINMSDGRVVAT